MLRKDRVKDKGGGLVFLVHQDIPFEEIPTPPDLANDPHAEVLTIKIPGKSNSLKIRNVYIPPTTSCCTPQYKAPMDKILENLDDSTLVLGDFNAHNEAWHSELEEDARGNLINNIINTHPLGILNENNPTRLSSSGTKSSPDISLATNDILPSCKWKVDTSLSSDHLPITISISTSFKRVKSEKRTFVNFAKADWAEFTNWTEKVFSRQNSNNDVHKDERTFREIINKAAKKFIPSGRIPKIINNIPTDAAKLSNERDNLRKNDPDNARINTLTKEINEKINEHRKKKWNEHLDTCNTDSKKLWSTIKSLQGQPQQPSNQSINFNGKPYNHPKSLANNFNKQYTPAANTIPSQKFRSTLRKMQKPPTDPKIILIPSQVSRAIKKSKSSKAIGPDGISPVMLKHIGPHGLKFLTNIYNNSISQAIIPTLWKTGRIIPLLKPGKSASEGKSYRPISLLSPAAKILESLLLPTISDSIQFAQHQHGFMKGRSTNTALHEISEHITKGLNIKRPVDRTVLVALDLSRAFDTVNHDILLTDISKLNLNANIKRFLCAYLRGRCTYVEFRGSKSKYRKMKQGVPQGGVLSPILFNLYMSEIPYPPGNIRLTTYADDSTALNSGPDVDKVCSELNPYLDKLDTWFTERNLFISAEKCTATVFSTFKNDMARTLPIYIKGKQIPTVKHPKILGVTFDNLWTFKQHSHILRSTIQKRTNHLKCLSGTTWGMDKETLARTYKATIQSCINYCPSIWGPNLSDCHWKELQIAQNAALRVVTGCVKKTQIDHLHTEANMMPVREHCDMLASQYLLKTQLAHHPVHLDLNEPKPAKYRLTKTTLRDKYENEVKTVLNNESLNDTNYKSKLKLIHTRHVSSMIQNRKPNPVTGRPAPKVNNTETQLPRRTRCLLAQLRDGHSSHLNSFLSTFKPGILNVCPKCRFAAHTTDHLFNCPADPTDLTVECLWTKPMDVANFLGLLPTDDE